MHRFALVAVLLLSGCLLDPHRQQRTARFLIGANARGLATPDKTYVAREAVPGETVLHAGAAQTGSGQFTTAIRNFIYGFELEAGRLDNRGSNYAGAYGVVGAEHAVDAGSVSVELASGWRALRYGMGVDDENDIIVEPRARAQYRVGSQVTIGAVTGASVTENGSWMFGIYLGFHSKPYGEK